MAGESEQPDARGPASRLLWILFAGKLGVALWAADRGFELGDEGYFLLNLRHPEGAPPPFEFYRLLGIGGGLPIGVVGARLLRIAIELAASLALAFAVFAWARARLGASAPGRPGPFLAFCALGTLLTAASRSFGYNDATNLCLYGATACLFALAARPDAAAAFARCLAAGAAGALTALQLSVKFPPAIVFAALTPLLLCVALRHFSPAARAQHVGAWALGVLAGAALVIAPTGGIDALAARLAIARELPAITGYDPLGLLGRSVALEIWSYVNFAVIALAFGLFFGRARRRGAALDAAFARAFVFAALLCWLVVLPLHPTFVSWTLVYLACLLLFVPIALALLLRPRLGGGADALETFGLLGLLVLLPFVAMLGTNVPLIVRLSSHALPLFAALAVLALGLRASAGLVRSARRITAVLALVTSLAFAQHHVLAPYGLPRPLFEQTVPLASLPGVRVDAASATFLDGVVASLREAGMRPGDPVVALDYMPGLVFLAGGVSPGSNLYMFDKPALDCFWLNRVRFERPPFLILGEPMAAEQQACLETIEYPGAFRSLRALSNPYERVYEGFGRPGFSHVLLFAPR